MIRPLFQLLHQWLTIYSLHYYHWLSLLQQPAMSSYIIYREGGRCHWPGVGSQWMAFSGINLLKIKSFVLGPDWLHHISIMDIGIHFVSSNISQLRGNPPTLVEEEGKPKVRSDSPELVLSLIVSDWHWKLERPTLALEGGHCTQCVVNTPIWT